MMMANVTRPCRQCDTRGRVLDAVEPDEGEPVEVGCWVCDGEGWVPVYKYGRGAQGLHEAAMDALAYLEAAGPVDALPRKARLGVQAARQCLASALGEAGG